MLSKSHVERGVDDELEDATFVCGGLTMTGSFTPNGVISPEGPQRVDLAPDVAAALGENPAAGAFFDTLAQFYRKAYLRWIDATKRRPNERAVRIAEVVGLLADGIKERPKP